MAPCKHSDCHLYVTVPMLYDSVNILPSICDKSYAHVPIKYNMDISEITSVPFTLF